MDKSGQKQKFYGGYFSRFWPKNEKMVEKFLAKFDQNWPKGVIFSIFMGVEFLVMGAIFSVFGQFFGHEKIFGQAFLAIMGGIFRP